MGLPAGQLLVVSDLNVLLMAHPSAFDLLGFQGIKTANLQKAIPLIKDIDPRVLQKIDVEGMHASSRSSQHLLTNVMQDTITSILYDNRLM